MASTKDVKIGNDDAEWLNEDDRKRVKMLEKLTGATLKVSAMTKEVTLEYSEDSDGGGAEWGEHCVKALLAMKMGETMEAAPLPDTTATWTPPVKTIKVPKDPAKNFLLGREGARVREWGDDLGVIMVFVKEVKFVEEKPLTFEVGTLVEAKFKGKERWFEAEIKGVTDDKCMLRWTYDDDVPQEEVPKSEIRAMPAKAEPIDDDMDVDEELKVGSLGEALFDGKGKRMFEVKVTEIDGADVTVKWTYDDDVPESKLKKSDIKTKPKPVTEKLRLYGSDRALLQAELRVLQCVEGKVPGFAAANASPSGDAHDGLGLSIVPMVNNGEFKAKLVGPKGSMRKKLCAACGSSMEYPGNDAFIVGTKAERERTAGLLDLVQTQSRGDVSAVPKALADMCTRIFVPAAKVDSLMGAKRANMNKVEDDTGTLSFWVPSDEPKKEEKKEEPEFTPKVGELYEGRFVDPKKGDRWFEVKVLEEVNGDGDAKKYKVEWQYDPDEKSELPVSSLRAKGSAPAKFEAVDKTLGIFGTEENRKNAAAKVQDLLDGKDIWPKNEWSGGSSWGEPEAKKPKIEYTVTDEEEERRKKRAARFG